MDRNRPTARRRAARVARPWAESLEDRQLMATTTFVVTNTNDTGAGSFRQALLDVAGSKAKTNFEIDFAIPGTGVHSFRPATPLPVVPVGTTINGFSQPGYAGTPLIQLDGTAEPTYRAPGLYTEGLILRGGDGVFGLSIYGFKGDQILVTGEHCGIQGNYIGTNASGEYASGGDQAGISVLNTGFTAIGGTGPGQANVISGNHWGVFAANAYAVTIAGNAIGLDAARTRAIGNDYVGVELVSTHDSDIGDGSAAGSNAIGGSLFGIYLTSTPGGNTNYSDKFQGNQLGQNAAGAPIPNAMYDLFLDFNNHGVRVAGNTFGAIANSDPASPLPVVRDVNPGNTYTNNIGFDAAARQVDVAATSTYTTTSTSNNKVYAFKSTFTVTNNGPQAATNVVLTIFVEPNGSFRVVGYDPATTGVFDPPFAQSGGNTYYIIKFGTLAKGQTASITLNCVNPGGSIAGHLDASVASDGIDNNTNDKYSKPF